MKRRDLCFKAPCSFVRNKIHKGDLGVKSHYALICHCSKGHFGYWTWEKTHVCGSKKLVWSWIEIAKQRNIQNAQTKPFKVLLSIAHLLLRWIQIFGKGLYFPILIDEVGTGTFLSNPDRRNLAISVEVPLGHTSPQLTRALHTHSSSSLGGCFATWDFLSSQEHLRTGRKASKLWLCLCSTKGSWHMAQTIWIRK